jgi:hypothetical protein
MTRYAIAFLAASCMGAPAHAQQGAFCGPRDRIVEQLADKHGETRRAVGLQQNMQVMETFANTETGSWTIIVSMPTGVACLVAAGEAFQLSAPETPGEPS